MATKNKAKLVKLINKVACKACQNEETYCLLKEIVICSHQDVRFLSQLKCVEHWKYEESERAKKDVGWDNAHMSWVSNGLAKLFAELYDEDKDPDELYKELIKIAKEQKLI